MKNRDVNNEAGRRSTSLGGYLRMGTVAYLTLSDNPPPTNPIEVLCSDVSDGSVNSIHGTSSLIR